jgi:hypothetical protein
MDESELVIVCHCEKHPQLYIIKDDTLGRQLDNTIISFVDPDVCEGNTWDKIASRSKQYVWAFNCPIGPAIVNPEFTRDMLWTQIFLEIIRESKRILKPGGQFISGIGNQIDIDTVHLDKFINVPELSGFEYKLVKANDFTFNLGKRKEGKPSDYKRNLIVFTKVAEGGKRKRLTRKRKTRRHR